MSGSSQNGARTTDNVSTRDSLTRVRRLEQGDRAEWRRLWELYLQPTAGARSPGFYLQRPPDQVIEVAFDRLVDRDRQPHALVAVSADRLVGFAHYIFHPSTWSTAQVCYLEDLYVEPARRRAGAGRALIRALYAAADEAKAAAVYWVTHESNVDAQGFFETLARRTDLVRYERQTSSDSTSHQR